MIVVERAGKLVIGNVERTYAIRAARRLCKTHGAIFRVRDTETSSLLYTARPESNERRKACDCPATCFGPRREQHAITCRPARPRCRWRRRAQGLCHCDRYHFPHRDGGGHCGNEAAYVEHMMTPRRRAA